MFRAGAVAMTLGVIFAATEARAQDAPGAVPPPVEQWTADCSRPVYATDQLVCVDTELRAVDARLRQRLATGHFEFAPPWLEDQGQWLRRRSLCAFKTAHRDCALAAYASRTAILDLMAGYDGKGTPMRCDTGVGTVAKLTTDSAVVADAAGRVVAVAFATGRDENWDAFASFSMAGRKLVISTLEGKRLTCRLKRDSRTD